jgi:hypothetical protein
MPFGNAVIYWALGFICIIVVIQSVETVCGRWKLWRVRARSWWVVAETQPVGQRLRPNRQIDCIIQLSIARL